MSQGRVTHHIQNLSLPAALASCEELGEQKQKVVMKGRQPLYHRGGPNSVDPTLKLSLVLLTHSQSSHKLFLLLSIKCEGKGYKTKHGGDSFTITEIYSSVVGLVVSRLGAPVSYFCITYEISWLRLCALTHA